MIEIPQIAFYLILGIPLMVYSGVITITSVIVAAAYGAMAMNGKAPLKHHLIAVAIALTLAVFHLLLGATILLP
ncbi:MAG: hypothetical protein PHG23_01915 [Candidatus Pacebacteria bacterium]|nr:hypothetical protein [Candidatus Paceibacterota bacterium]